MNHVPTTSTTAPPGARRSCSPPSCSSAMAFLLARRYRTRPRAVPPTPRAAACSNRAASLSAPRSSRSRSPTRYFSPRPSAANYDPMRASGSNQARSNPDLRQRLDAALAAVAAREGVARESVPGDLVTESASGLDPHLSPAAARVAGQARRQGTRPRRGRGGGAARAPHRAAAVRRLGSAAGQCAGAQFRARRRRTLIVAQCSDERSTFGPGRRPHRRIASRRRRAAHDLPRRRAWGRQDLCDAQPRTRTRASRRRRRRRHRGDARRAETAALLDGLEQIPRRRIEYPGACWRSSTSTRCWRVGPRSPSSTNSPIATCPAAATSAAGRTCWSCSTPASTCTPRSTSSTWKA